MVAKGEGVRGGMDWEVGVSRCMLLYTEWINKVLLYSTENYIQYSMICTMSSLSIPLSMGIYAMEYYSTIKKNEIVPFAATWMDLDGIMMGEISEIKTNTV